MKLFLTGEPGVGKTTIIREVIEETPLSFWVISEEIRDDNNAREGFRAKNSDGQQAIFAHKTNIISRDQVGSFRVDLGGVDTVFSKAIEKALGENKTIFIIDEIGRMEVFVACIRHCN